MVSESGSDVARCCTFPIVLVARPEALVRFERSGKRGRAQMGALAILHTWNRCLLMHGHNHVLVIVGRLSLDGKRWIALPQGDFLPLEPIAALYRQRMLRAVERAYRNGKLVFPNTWQDIAQPAAFEQWLAPLREIDWVVLTRSVWHRYGPQDTEAAAKTVNYLARYVNRVATSYSRQVATEEDDVTFRYKDAER